MRVSEEMKTFINIFIHVTEYQSGIYMVTQDTVNIES